MSRCIFLLGFAAKKCNQLFYLVHLLVKNFCLLNRFFKSWLFLLLFGCLGFLEHGAIEYKFTQTCWLFSEHKFGLFLWKKGCCSIHTMQGSSSFSLQTPYYAHISIQKINNIFWKKMEGKKDILWHQPSSWFFRSQEDDFFSNQKASIHSFFPIQDFFVESHFSQETLNLPGITYRIIYLIPFFFGTCPFLFNQRPLWIANKGWRKMLKRGVIWI